MKDHSATEEAGPASGQSLENAPIELAVVVPTFNEAGNVAPLLEAVFSALEGRSFEIIYVDDDSPDGTAEKVREFARKDLRVRCLHRYGRRGLSSACVEGAFATSAPYVAVIDGDMQHDEKLLPQMLDTLKQGDLDLVVGSRYVGEGSFGEWTQGRIRASQFATYLAKKLTRVTLTDPMSGFFMIRTDLFRDLTPRLSAVGFKILLDLFASSRTPLRFAELPFVFRTRAVGESKMDMKVLLEFFELLLDKTVGHLVPAKFLMFALVGSVGVGVHFAVLSLLFGLGMVSFQTGQIVATLVAMTSNFAMNNVFTHYDRRLTGWGWVRGWFSFSVASSVGAVANVGVATYLFEQQGAVWYLSALAGIVMAVVWNYVVTSFYTWKRK